MRVVFHHDAGEWLRGRLDELGDQGIEVEIIPPTNRPAFLRALGDCEVLWHVLEPVTADFIEAAPNLRLIQKIGVGVNTIDLDAAREKSVVVCNMPGTNTRAVAEMTLMLMLSALRRASMLDAATRRGEGWSMSPEMQGHFGEIAGKTVGLVGYGAVPRLLAPVLEAMDARVLYTATSSKSDAIGEWRTLPDLVRDAHIVSVHVPLTPQTENLIDRACIASFRSGAVLVNTSRGEVVDQGALVDALEDGRIKAAGLDVFSTEPVSLEDPILNLGNVVLAPHVAWLTRETLERSIEVAVDNCIRLASGHVLRHQVV